VTLERYVAVDPGVATGVVVVDLVAGWRERDLYSELRSQFQLERDNPQWQRCRVWELHGDESAQIDEICAVIFGRKGGAIPASAVICEDFVLRERTKSRDLLAPVRLAAMLQDRLYCGSFRGEFVLQTPSDAKSIVTDERLKSWGLWHEGSLHIRDAWRHLIKYLRENR
jgi:hypothetical protein